MQQFKIGEEGYKKFRKNWIRNSVPVTCIILAGVILIQVFSPGSGDTSLLPFVIPFLILFFGVSLFRAFRKQKQLLLSYSVTVTDSEITREQLNTPTLSISFMEIREIIKTRKGHFNIEGATRRDIIFIPKWIDNYAALEERLKTFAPITIRARDPFFMRYRLFLTILFLAMMAALYTMTNKIIVGICGFLVAGLIIWAFFEIRVNKNLPRNTKRMSWVFLLIGVSILYAVYIKLTDGKF